MWQRVKDYFLMPSSPPDIINSMYQMIDGSYISQAERRRLDINDTSFVYGEIVPETFLKILDIVKPQPNEIFYDLGSGTGKAVFTAALQYQWKKCIGIELLPGLAYVSQELLKKLLIMEIVQQKYLENVKAVEYINDDFMNVDFSDGDVFFVNATTLNVVLWSKLETKLAELKLGARIVTTTRQLNNGFEKIHEEIFEMSWGGCTVFVFQKV